MNQGLQIVTEPGKLDIPFIHAFLSQSYWAKGRSEEMVRRSMDHSLNFGLFLDEKQIGYARVLSDRVAFAYLMDVFIAEEHREHGYGEWFLRQVLDHPDVASIPTIRLATRDAHGLYAKLGFTALGHPERMMERVQK